MNTPIRIALVDDESLFLEGLVVLLANESILSIVSTADDGSTFLRQLSGMTPQQFPDVALVDIQMHPMNGFELVETLKIKYPDLKVIILSSHYKNSMLGHMIKLGVSAFIPKNASRDFLVAAIQSVYKTGVFFTQRDHQMLIDYMKSASRKPSFDPTDQLTDRELEVVKLICAENTNQEIANQLFISKRTVESHRQRILDKIGAKNTVGLVVYAIANEIYFPPPPYGYV